jgi:hypothetical protein
MKVATNSVVANALAANSWSMVFPGLPIFMQDSPPVEVCRAFNQRAYGLDGVLAKARSEVASQCFGQPQGALQVVIGRNAEQLLAAVTHADSRLSAELVLVGGIPAADDESAWAVSPTPPAAPEVVVQPPGPAVVEFSPVMLFLPKTGNYATYRNVGLTNTGESPLTITNVQRTISMGNFSIASSTCLGTFAPGESCNVSLRFEATGSGEHSGTIRFTRDAETSPDIFRIQGSST